MKKLFTLCALLFSATITTTFAGQIEKNLDPFTSVSVTGNYKVFLIESETEKIVVSNNDPNVEDEKILITVEGGTLDIKIKGDTYKQRSMEVTIYYKKVNQIDSKRGAIVTLNNVLKGDVIIFNCSTGGQVKGEIEATTAKLKISNDGLINLTGKATIAEMEVSTGGTMACGQLFTETSSAKVTAGGSITVNASKKLVASVTSGGTISYKGNPEIVEESIKLGGTISKSNNQ